MSVQTIHMHGFMGQKYGKTVKLDGANMFQIMSGLVSRFGPQFKEDVRTNNWHIVEGTLKGKQDIGEQELSKKLQKKVLHLLPAVEGASSGLRVVFGVVLIAVGIFVPGAQWAINIGAALVIGGVAEMLMRPKVGSPDSKADEKGSQLYNGALNVTSQGGPIPLIYGRVQRCSSVVISADFSSEDATIELPPGDANEGGRSTRDPLRLPHMTIRGPYKNGMTVPYAGGSY